ncbi:MAG: ubiquione/menaquione biosynthesis methyltransferase-like protein [Candidatus Bathyarchaeota archaeon B23]|nr:MAG: ubiquione/menaquione biosynthesis methyltransferase-like protein [Candidatus Bathyarchaeota archaeon B23]
MADPFGRALWRYHRGERVRCLIHRDDGYVDEDTMEWYFQRPEEWPDVEREAVRWARGRVLDLGCGAGRHLLWLQGEGHEAVGVDLSPFALRVSRERGAEHCLLMDARSLGFREGVFDALLMMGNNFGIAGGPQETVEMLRELHRVTRMSGIIVATSRDPLDTDNPRHLAYHERNRRRRRPLGLVTIHFELQGEIGPWFDLWLATPEEMEETAERAGWRMSRLYRGEGVRGLYSAILVRGGSPPSRLSG